MAGPLPGGIEADDEEEPTFEPNENLAGCNDFVFYRSHRADEV